MKWFVLLLLLLTGPALAVEPSEILDDPVLEDRARDLSAGLRCPICQNESIDESHADLARELRLVLRERLVAGDSDDQVIAYMVTRYGEFVLLKPTVTGANLFLWLAAPIMLLLACWIGWVTIRRKPRTIDELAPDEQAALEKILKS